MPLGGEGPAQTLASLTNQLIGEEGDPKPVPNQPMHRQPQTTTTTLETLAARILVKLEESEFRSAVHIASSKGTIANLNEETLTALRDKCPSPHDYNISWT